MTEQSNKHWKKWILFLIISVQLVILIFCISSIKTQNLDSEHNVNEPIKIEAEKAKYIATVSKIDQWSEEDETKTYYLTFGIRDDQIMDIVEKDSILYLTDEKQYVPIEDAIENSKVTIMNASNPTGTQITYVKLKTYTMIDTSRLFILLKNDVDVEKAAMFTISKSFNIGEFVNAPNKKDNTGIVRVYNKDADEKHFFEILEKCEEEEDSIYWKVQITGLSKSNDFATNINKTLSFLDKKGDPIEDLSKYNKYELFCEKDKESDCYLIGCRMKNGEKINIKNENVSGLAYLYDMTLKFTF